MRPLGTSSVADEVKQRVDIVEYISRYTPLKKAGASYKGTCPFHSERTPSFVVFPSSATWHCFGQCGDGGDIFNFVMKKERCDFREALQILARYAGIDLQETESDPAAAHRGKLYEVNEAACSYFGYTLHNHPAAQPARDYLAKRGIDLTVTDSFRLGFALESWNSLRDYLMERGFGLDILQEAGLVKRNEEKGSTYDAFRNRVIFPIRDRQGRVIGFGGRVMDDSQPKYLNTGETPIFHKSHVIYGLDLAHRAVREQNQVVIVEGYMDVIANHQFGFHNVVACMGTALTADQLRQLQTYTTNFVLALDADAAGQQATIRGLNQARQSLNRVRKPVATATGVQMTERLAANIAIIAMPVGKDPDELIRRDVALWKRVLADALPLVDYYFEVVGKQADLNSATGKAQAVAELTPLIAELSDEIERQHYAQRLSRLVQIDEMTIMNRVQAATTTRNAGVDQQRAERQEGSQAGERRSNSVTKSRSDAAGLGKIFQATDRAPQLELEAHLLALLLLNPDLLVWLTTAMRRMQLDPLQLTDWQHVEHQEIFRALKRYLAGDDPWEIELFQETVDEHLRGRYAQLMAYAAALPPSTLGGLREDVMKSLVRIRMEHLRAETTRVKFLVEEAQQQNDRESVIQFSRINNQHVRAISHLQQTFARIQMDLFQQARSENSAPAL